MLRGLFGDLIGLLFPNLCAACGLHLYRGEHHICTKCRYELPYSDHDQYADHAAAKKFWGRVQLKGVFALLRFEKGNRVQHLLHHLKYKNCPKLGEELGRMIGEKLRQHPDFSGVSLIVPVPLHPHREKLRGYNQSFLIACGISAQMNVPIEANALYRIKATASQTKKGRFGRHENMTGVFELKNPGLIVGKHLLLVDDVITTGATLEACAAMLLNQGAAGISIAAAAFAD